MKKLKWKFTDKFKQYGTERWSAGNFIIERDRSCTWLFNKKTLETISKFKKLTSAMEVAQLIHNG